MLGERHAIFVSDSSEDQPLKSAGHGQFLMTLTGVSSIEHLQNSFL